MRKSALIESCACQAGYVPTWQILRCAQSLPVICSRCGNGNVLVLKIWCSEVLVTSCRASSFAELISAISYHVIMSAALARLS